MTKYPMTVEGAARLQEELDRRKKTERPARGQAIAEAREHGDAFRTDSIEILRAAGLTDAEIDWIAEGPTARGWSEFDAALVRAADELHDDAMLSDATWKTFAQRYDTQQLMDLIFTVGQYHTVSMALNSLGVQTEQGEAAFPRPPAASK